MDSRLVIPSALALAVPVNFIVFLFYWGFKVLIS